MASAATEQTMEDPSSQAPPPYASARPTGEQRGNLFSRLFPLGYKEGFNQWWASLPAATTEHQVLSFIPYLQQPPTHQQTGKEATPAGQDTDTLVTVDTTQSSQESANSVNDPHGPRRWRSSMVQLSGKNRALNEFSVERVGEEVENNLVILHGYGAGLGFFYKNFEGLSRPKGWQLYALDLLGMGRSTRPAFKIKSKKREDAITEAEDWFVDALEEWRVKRKIDRFTLLGHSMGGYMAVAYALKYPGRLNKLILASPVGIPEDPYAVSTSGPEPTDSTMANEFTQDQNDTTQPSNGANLPPKRVIPKWLTYLWDANVSPFSLVRWSGPLGPRLVSGWTSRRFSHLPQNEAEVLHDYAYSLFRMRGSGEYALSYILAPGAYARSPLIRRIHGVGRQPLFASNQNTSTCSENNSSPPSRSQSTSESASLSDFTKIDAPTEREKGLPIVLMYGEHDWMDVAGGLAAQEKIDQEKARVLKDATPEEREADRGSAKVVIIKKAGHHVYLDGWQEFNDVVLKEMDDVSRSN
ncbi:hypothetical protein FQN57_007432 [Myotisia sp. PD_48]|nr:hypothetical protein FQN57_007432 [Myotisia sp. PD_48]